MLRNVDASKFPMRIEGEARSLNILPVVVRLRDKISAIPKMEVHFFSANKEMPLDSIVGKTVHFHVMSSDFATEKWFRGTCISAQYQGDFQDGGYYIAEVSPWLWFLTRRTDCRIFQNLSVIDIIKKVLDEHGFSGNLKKDTNGNYKKREYCVQYRETDFDFISRLMEEEGIYYYFDHKSSTEKMVLADAPGSHSLIDTPNEMRLIELARRAGNEKTDPAIFEWNARANIRSGKVTLEDYDFENSTAKLKVESKINAGSYTRDNDNRYDYPGHYRKANLGEDRAKIRMEADAIQHHVIDGLSDAAHLEVGKKLGVSDMERIGEPTEGLLIECEQDFVQLELLENRFFKPEEILATTGFDLEQEMPHMARFKAIEGTAQYRAPFVTKWPVIGGIHTAVVTGPGGEEIHTDKYGRIKVQFHWDLDGEKNDKSSCWVRTMMPWTGNNWGAIAIPRIGQEVVIQFEEGDPDRPLCVGMLYNDKTMPPYSLPDNKTQSGVKTNSSLGGGGFNELMFEDKRGEELVRFQAEKDYRQIVKNNAEISVGMEKMEEGNLDQTIHNNFTETIMEGDHSTTLHRGSHYTTLDMGDMEVQVSKGKIFAEAKQSIELKVGMSTIKLMPQSIEIKSLTVSVEGTANVDVTGATTTVNGDMMLVLTGGMVNIN